MSRKVWLIVDANFLCWRSFHAMGDLSHGGEKTAILYGFLRDVFSIANEFQTTGFVFCFDHGRNLRTLRFPEYKQKRHKENLTEEKRQSYFEMQKQVTKLKREYLKTFGFSNVLYCEGFESDDLIASVCATLPKSEEAVIVTADKDMLQCLRKGVCMYNPTTRKVYTATKFRKEWRLPPRAWAKVKAIAGCPTDEVPGIPGVGEATAAKYLRGELSDRYVTYGKIKAGWESIVRRNWPLVRLPYKGTPAYTLEADNFDGVAYARVMRKHGMHSLIKLQHTKRGFRFNG